MRRTIVFTVAAGLAACNADADSGQPADAAPRTTPVVAAASPVAAPDLAGCPARAKVDGETRERTRPIAVPAALRGVMRGGVDNIAISTLGGATVCIDASWIEGIDAARLSSDKRFASFDWVGYEAFGHVIVDRSGKGADLDTGSAPLVSPSGRLWAVADLTEAGYGALNAFAVWQVEPSGLKPLMRQEEVPPATDWTVDRWAGEDCIELTAVLWAELTDPDQTSAPPRRPYRARRDATWRLEPGDCRAP
jgi:hypothetical protein